MKKENSQSLLFNAEAIVTGKTGARQKDHFVFDILDALSAPILTFSMQWADLIPKRLLNQVTIARMISLMKGEELASYIECCAYLYTRSHEAPMDHEWADIYTHVSCQTLSDWFREDHWDNIKAPKILHKSLEAKLVGLRRHIYNKRREILRQRIKLEEKSQAIPHTNTESISNACAPKQLKIQQASFDF